MGDDTPIRPVAEKAWLKPTGGLPLGYNWSSDRKLSYDSRVAADGGCDSPAHFEGCQAYYMKVHPRTATNFTVLCRHQTRPV